MKIRSLAMFSALAFLAVSCEENINKGTVWDNPNFIRVTSTREPMLERDAKVGFGWAIDTIGLYDQQYREVPIRNNEEGSKIFFSYDWTASQPGYAVYPRSENITMQDGYVTFNVPSKQSISRLETYVPGVFVGKVTGNSSAYKLNPLKNTLSQFKLSMSDSTATSIRIESIGGEPIVGNVTVDCAKLINDEEGFLTIADDDIKSSAVVITPEPESDAISLSGCLHAGAYYVSIIPQTFAQGIKVTVERKDAEPIVRVMGVEGGCVAKRGEVLEFPGDLDDTLPDEFTVRLDFQEISAEGVKKGIWPFVEAKVANDATYTYAYKYDVDGIEMTANLKFFISGNKAAYNITVNGLRMTAKNSRFTIPAVSDRYLKSLTMDVTNAYAKGFALVKMDWSVLYTGPNATAGKPASVTFPAGDVTTEKDTEYYLRFTAANSDIKSITMVFSKTLD